LPPAGGVHKVFCSSKRYAMQELMKAQKNVEMFFAEEKDTAKKEPTR